MTLKVLDLFSGIGGFSLGLERTGGFRTVAFCEIDPFCRRVLAKHWPEVRCYEDVRELTAARLAADGIGVDVLCGGFPCQDISVAGFGVGLDGERSGLWSEFARLIRELRPRYAIVENVSALLHRGLDRVLGDLAAIGFDAEWHCIPAQAVGAPHRRDRVWIVAYPNRDGEHALSVDAEVAESQEPVADADRAGPQGWNERQRRSRECLVGPGSLTIAENWFAEPDVGRVAHGVPARVDRLRSLGNGVVPQIPEFLGRAILAAERGPA